MAGEKDFDPKPGDAEEEVQAIMHDLSARIAQLLLEDKEVNELIQLGAEKVNDLNRPFRFLDSRGVHLLKHVIRTEATHRALSNIVPLDDGRTYEPL